MGTKQQTYATIRTALERIADRRLAAASNVHSPDQYRDAILAELRSTHHDEALGILETATEPIDAATLADMLEPPAPQRPPDPAEDILRAAEAEHAANAARLDAIARIPPDPALARARIAAIRADLTGRQESA